MSRTARIEPITPPGEVYVSEPFAAGLVLADRRDLTCDYVGHMPMAKGYGRLPDVPAPASRISGGLGLSRYAPGLPSFGYG